MFLAHRPSLSDVSIVTLVALSRKRMTLYLKKKIYKKNTTKQISAGVMTKEIDSGVMTKEIKAGIVIKEFKT